MSSASIALGGSGAIVLCVYFLAYLVSRKINWREKIGNKIGALFAISLFIFVDALLFRVAGVSFSNLLINGSNIPFIIFVAGMVIGVAYEYVGQFTLSWWYYPSVQRKRFHLFLLPFFWGLFMLIMQDTWGVYMTLGFGVGISTILTAMTHFILIEGINVFTNSWVYRRGWTKSPVVLFLGWIVLSLTFVVGFNRFFISPFGF